MWCVLFLRHLVNVVKSTLLETWNFPHGFNCCYQVIGITVWTDSWFPPTWDPIVERNGKCVAFWKKRLFFLIGNRQIIKKLLRIKIQNVGKIGNTIVYLFLEWEAKMNFLIWKVTFIHHFNLCVILSQLSSSWSYQKSIWVINRTTWTSDVSPLYLVHDILSWIFPSCCF